MYVTLALGIRVISMLTHCRTLREL